jgi:RNA polymerase sigma-70 factor, ECF subfamily
VSAQSSDDDFKRDLTGLIPHMRAFARSLCGDATQGDDLAQEGLLKAWQSRASFTPGTNLKAWTFMIVRNQFYSDKRRSWRQHSLDPETAERTLVATDNPIATLELDEVRRALAMLPEDQREALILVGAGGLSYEEVADIQGCPTGTIKSRVSRARDRLALILAEGAIDQDDLAASSALPAILAQLQALQGDYEAAA